MATIKIMEHNFSCIVLNVLGKESKGIQSVQIDNRKFFRALGHRTKTFVVQ